MEPKVCFSSGVNTNGFLSPGFSRLRTPRQAWCLCRQGCRPFRARQLRPSLVSKHAQVYLVPPQLHPFGPSLLPHIPQPTRQCFKPERELTAVSGQTTWGHRTSPGWLLPVGQEPPNSGHLPSPPGVACSRARRAARPAAHACPGNLPLWREIRVHPHPGRLRNVAKASRGRATSSGTGQTQPPHTLRYNQSGIFSCLPPIWGVYRQQPQKWLGDFTWRMGWQGFSPSHSLDWNGVSMFSVSQARAATPRSLSSLHSFLQAFPAPQPPPVSP